MGDQIDQINEAQARFVQPAAARTSHVFTYVYQIDGKWQSITLQGALSDCNEAVLEHVRRRGAELDKIRWARGHKDGNRLAIHPKTDAQAEAEIIKVMNRKPKPKQVGSRS